MRRHDNMARQCACTPTEDLYRCTHVCCDIVLSHTACNYQYPAMVSRGALSCHSRCIEVLSKCLTEVISFKCCNVLRGASRYCPHALHNVSSMLLRGSSKCYGMPLEVLIAKQTIGHIEHCVTNWQTAYMYVVARNYLHDNMLQDMRRHDNMARRCACTHTHTDGC
jgi:hypothetical protein